jgi:hypothetical protein
VDLWQASTERANRQAICDAYATIDLGMEDAPNQSVVVLGAAAVDRPVLKQAEEVNPTRGRIADPMRAAATYSSAGSPQGRRYGSHPGGTRYPSIDSTE